MRKEHIANVHGFNRIKTGALCQEDEMLSSIMSYVSRQMCPSHVAWVWIGSKGGIHRCANRELCWIERRTKENLSVVKFLVCVRLRTNAGWSCNAVMDLSKWSEGHPAVREGWGYSPESVPCHAPGKSGPEDCPAVRSLSSRPTTGALGSRVLVLCCSSTLGFWKPVSQDLCIELSLLIAANRSWLCHSWLGVFNRNSLRVLWKLFSHSVSFPYVTAGFSEGTP